jgi:hypothetical protein
MSPAAAANIVIRHQEAPFVVPVCSDQYIGPACLDEETNPGQVNVLAARELGLAGHEPLDEPKLFGEERRHEPCIQTRTNILLDWHRASLSFRPAAPDHISKEQCNSASGFDPPSQLYIRYSKLQDVPIPRVKVQLGPEPRVQATKLQRTSRPVTQRTGSQVARWHVG